MLRESSMARLEWQRLSKPTPLTSRHGFKTLAQNFTLHSKYYIRVIGGSASGNILEVLGHHCLILANDPSPANLRLGDEHHRPRRR